MKKITTLSLLFLFTILFINAQTTITVDNTVGADANYSDLQAAINAASAGDIIYIHASEINYGNIQIDKSINLIGYAHSDIDKNTFIDDIIFLDNSSDTRVTGLNIDDVAFNNSSLLDNIIFENNYFGGSNSSGSGVSANNGLVNNLIFRGNVIDFIGTTSASTTANNFNNIIVSNNIVTGNINIRLHETAIIENNIFIDFAGASNRSVSTGNLEVEDSIFYIASSGNPADLNNEGVIYNNCLTYNSISGVLPLNGSNNINDTDPLFVNVSNPVFDPLFDYSLQAGSPALMMGTDNDDIGLYSTNTNFTFNNFGFTAGIPIVTITAITSQIAPGGTLEVTIQSNSN
ncbi:right-handed parallel beta-helix repeat-containing protein [Winogradskyella alexanderae]|uniref:Uncharacterized protein n=1 Tax=Winogradskyella alexanderae TaxID=2877123 RepID=A0ABS7XPJ9_9FLAO|nr:hypothetical protein [Winogradskyella alexanderae]MCA0131930.1 hypothetical protein [Winogradskyella alexanderae]